MPRRIIAFLLILSLSFQSFVKLGIVIWYHCNKDYIAQNLCENRAKPELNCCGKCYLNKQLKKADSGTSKNSSIPDKWNLGEVAVYTVPPLITVPLIPSFHTPSARPHAPESLSLGVHNGVFHPPSFC